MAESLPPNPVWQWDYIDHYRLDERIIGGFLTEKWGNYKYYVKARGCHDSPFIVLKVLTRGTSSARAMNLGSGCHEPLTK